MNMVVTICHVTCHTLASDTEVKKYDQLTCWHVCCT